MQVAMGAFLARLAPVVSFNAMTAQCVWRGGQPRTVVLAGVSTSTFGIGPRFDAEALGLPWGA